jgi:hypothetical protein
MFSVDDPIARHQKLLTEIGEVWFGKMGKSLGFGHVKAMNEQCAEGIPTFVYFVEKTKKGYQVYRGVVSQVSRVRPSDDEKVPRYYNFAKLFPYIKVWFLLTDLRHVEAGVLNKLRIATSGFPVSETLPVSMAAMFIVN